MGLRGWAEGAREAPPGSTGSVCRSRLQLPYLVKELGWLRTKFGGWRMGGSSVCGWHCFSRLPLPGAGSVLAWLPGHKAAPPPPGPRDAVKGDTPWGARGLGARPALTLCCGTGAVSATPKTADLELRLATSCSDEFGVPVLRGLGGCGALWCLCRSPHRNPRDRL